MSVENGKPGFEEAAAERELEELRRAIEESRGRRRRANEAFDEFLKGFGDKPRRAVAAPPPAEPPEPPERAQKVDAEAPHDAPGDDGLFAFSPAAAATAPGEPVTPPKPAIQSALDDFAHEERSTAGSQLRPIPAALAPARRSPAARLAPVAAIAVVGVLAAFLLLRGRSQEDAAPPVADTAPPAAAAPAPPAAATSGVEKPPTAEISTIRRVWLRVTVDGERVVEREVAEGTTLPVNATSQIVIRAGDAGAVRVSIAGKDQGVLGPAGQVATRTFTVKP
jgi:hypothetical protein